MAKAKEFKITTTVESFRDALKASFREKKPTIPILTYFLVDGTKVNGTDLDNHTSVPFTGKGKGCFTLPANQTEKLLNGEKGPLAIRFVPDDKKLPTGPGWAHLEFGGCTFKLPTLATTNWPLAPAAADTQLSTDGKSFRQAIERVRFAISNTESRYTMNGAKLEVKDGVLRLIATDGHRLAIASYKQAGDFECLIPRDTLDWLAANLGETVEFARKRDANIEQQSNLTIRTNGKTIIARELSGQFPSWRAICRDEYKHTATIRDPKRMANLLSKVAKCADDRSGCVGLTFETGKLTLRASSTEYGEASAELICMVEPELPKAFTIGINHAYLVDFLKHIGGDSEFHVGLYDEQSALSVYLERDTYEYIVMPMRLL